MPIVLRGYRTLDLAAKRSLWLAYTRRLHPITLERCSTCGIQLEVQARAEHDHVRCPGQPVLGRRSL